MAIIKNKLVRKFSTIPNAIITDLNVSSGALRVYLYLISKPDGWGVINGVIQAQLDIKQAQTIANYWKELINAGWINRTRILNDKKQYSGGYDYQLNEEPILNDTHNVENPQYGKSLPRENPENILSKTDLISKTESKVSTNKRDEFNFDGFIENEVAAINEWLTYKKERKQAYTTTGLKGLKTLLTNLKTKGQLLTAINNSIANNWSGLFEDKIITQVAKNKPSYHTMGDFTGQSSCDDVKF